MRRLTIGLIIAVALCAVPVFAAGPRPPVTVAAITLNVPLALQSFSAGLWPNLGDTVTFAVAYPKSAEKYGPRIQVMCYQGDDLVYGEAGPYYQGFLLGGAGSIWLYTNNGPAHCVADLYYWSYQGGQKFNWLASTEFDAGGK